MDVALDTAPVARPVEAGEPFTLACALEVEERAARRAGAQAVRIGLAASRPLPEGPIVGFGLAGALVPELTPGTLLTASRVVDEAGTTLWEGEPLPVPGAREAVVCVAGAVVDDPAERARLAARTGAVAVEMEGAALARSGRLAGVVRAVSDGPTRPVGRLATASTPDGGIAWGAVVAAFLREPVRSLRASRDARRGLAALEHAAVSLAGGAR
ncbi:MAG: hypothetical protein U0R69_15170 [Gaiellales bacterium]